VTAREVDGLFVSISQLKLWQQCPKKYEYRYVRGVEPEFVPMALAFGSAFHAALALHYEALLRGEVAPESEVKERFIDTLNVAKRGPVPLQHDEEDDGPFELVEAKGLQMLDVTLAHPSARPEKVLAVEKKFIVPLHDVETGEALDVQLLGVIDLVVEEEGHRVLVEHKTSAKKYSTDQLNFDTQLSAYSFAAEMMQWGEVGLRFSVTTKTKSPQVQLEDVRRDEGDMTDFLRVAAGVLKAIDVGISYPVRGWGCRTCPYRRRCESER